MNRRQMLGKLAAAAAAGIAGTLTRPNVPTPPALRAEDITWSGMTADRFSAFTVTAASAGDGGTTWLYTTQSGEPIQYSYTNA